MSSRKSRIQSAGGSANPLTKGKNYAPTIDQLGRSVADFSLDSSQDGDWEVCMRKSKDKAVNSAAKTWGSQNHTSQTWGHTDAVQNLGTRNNDGSKMGPTNNWPALSSDSRRPAGRGNGKSQSSNKALESSSVAPPAAIAPPQGLGWKWAAVAGANQSRGSENKNIEDCNPRANDNNNANYEDAVNDDDDIDPDSDDEFISDEYDSDTSEKSHETRKKSRWFKAFFDILDSLTVEEISELARQWHCPACQGGPGAIDWYRGLQPLMTHAKTKGGKRMKLHRELAELLDEELRRRGTSVIPQGEQFGKWKGLNETNPKDHLIVWPPMVIIMNTRLEQDENEKWIGMGNQELLDYFSSYAAVRARHSYGPQGHRGMSLLIFEASAVGYLEAERLHKHFEEQRTDREAWERRRVLFYPGGKRQLYGFMAVKEDVDIFNQHSQGKTRLRFEMRSYHEMVVSQMKQMNEDNQQLIWFKDKVAREQRHAKALEQSFGIVTEKLRKTMEENRIVRQRTKTQHEQNKEEMDFQEQFFKDQLQIIHEARDEKEDKFEMLQQEEREKVKQANASPTTKDHRLRAEETAKFIKLQDKVMEAFVDKREKLCKVYEERRVAMKQRHWEEEINMEKEFDAELTRLMEEYAPRQEDASGSL